MCWVQRPAPLGLWGLGLGCRKGPSSVLFSATPPALWATRFLLASPLCKVLLHPSARCSGVSRARAGCLGLQELPGGGVHQPQDGLLAGPPSPPSKWASYNLPARILTSSPHLPAGHLLSPAPLLHPPRLCRGEGPSPEQAPAHFWASPRERSLWPTPRPGCRHPGPWCPPALQGRAADAGGPAEQCSPAGTVPPSQRGEEQRMGGA